MKKIIAGFLIGICLMLSCGSSSMSDKSFKEYQSDDSTFISQVIKNSNFKIVEINHHNVSNYSHLKFYKVYVMSNSNNGHYVNEILVTVYPGYGVSAIELSNYHESNADVILNN